MKRTAIKQKTYEEKLAYLKEKQKERNLEEKTINKFFKKKVKTSKSKVVPISKLKMKLWAVCAKFIKERDGGVCFTSSVRVEGSNAHCGHGKPSSICNAILRYHPYNLHTQSMVENIHHSGNGGEYYRRQVSKYGQEKIDFLYQINNRLIKADKFFYEQLHELYNAPYSKEKENEIIDWLESRN